MLSGRLVHLIESNWDAITRDALEQIRKDPEMSHIASLPEAELHEWASDIPQHLGYWLAQGKPGELASRYEALGQLRFEEAMPLVEAVRGLSILKAKIFDHIQQRGFTGTATELYAEIELYIRLGRFFDFLIGHLVTGYEKALRRAANLEAAMHPAPRRRARG